MTLRPRRSVLYMPGANARALEKAGSSRPTRSSSTSKIPSAPDAKAAAREQVAKAVKDGGYGKRELVIRINALDTAWGPDDMRAAATAGPDAVLIPKASGAADIERASDALRRAGAPERTKLWAMVETADRHRAGRRDCRSRQPRRLRLACLVMGLNDLFKETRAEVTADRAAALYWLSASLTAARAFGLDILDGVYNNFRDADGYRRECLQGRMLGFDGKTLIHPDQNPDARSMATSGRGSGVVGYNVQVAVDTAHHLIVTHAVTNEGSDRSQLSPVAKETKATLDVGEARCRRRPRLLR